MDQSQMSHRIGRGEINNGDEEVIIMPQSNGDSAPPEYTLAHLTPLFEDISAYIEKHSETCKITKKLDLKINTISTKNFTMAIPNVPEHVNVVLITGDNPIFHVMNTQTSPEWRGRTWLYGSLFNIKSNQEPLPSSTAALAQMRFGTTVNLFKFVKDSVEKKLENLFSSINSPQEYMLYMVDEERFDATCTTIYHSMLNLQYIKKTHE